MATDLDVFRATVEHRRPARILYHFGLTDDLKKRLVRHIGTDKVAAHFGVWSQAGLSIQRPPNVPAPDYSRYWKGQELPPGTQFDGRGVAKVPSGFYHFWGYISPLRNATSLSELETYPIVEADSGWDFSYLKVQADRAHAEGKVVCGSVGHMYEDAWQIRGYEQFLMDMVERPAWAECLLERFMRRNLITATETAKAGADLIRCGDDVANQNAMMFSPDTWRKMMLSRWRKVWQAVKEINPRAQIWYHSDGNVSAIVGDLLEAGVDILNPLQPECLDVDAIHKAYGERLTFDGCIGTQSTMPFGTVEQVRARVRQVIDAYGRSGGLIVSPTHVLEPDVPIANIEALCQSCREHGTFERP